MNTEFYSNGKLLLSGEYAILDGAKGWAVPTKFGQSLKVAVNSSNEISWKSVDADTSVWFEARYKLETLEELFTTDKNISQNLLLILKQAKQLSPNFLTDAQGYQMETSLTFPRNWGLGTSSTLVNNISNWAKVNPYTLLSRTFGGSGYDIACAEHNKPLLYQLKDGVPMVEDAKPILPYADSLYFIYLNQKKNSRDAIAAYRKLNFDKEEFNERLSKITNQIITCTCLEYFEGCMELHENALSELLQIPTVKKKLFPDYSGGAIKSLGAWGGDFILATGDETTPTYFKNKGYTTIIPFSDMVLWE